jgi:DnaJ family protein C protein 11
MRAEYTRQAAEKKALQVQRLVNSKGSVSLSVDAQAILAPSAAFYGPRGPQDDSWQTRVRVVQAKGLALVQSWQAPLGEATMLEVTGTMSQRLGQRRAASKLGGNLIGTIRSQWTPKMYLEVSSSLLAPQVVATRAIYEIDEETSLEFSTRSMALLALPTADVTLHRLLSPTLKSWTTLHSGSLGGSGNDLSSLTIGATNLIDPSSPEGGWTGELAVGPGDATISLDWGRTVWAGWDVKVGGSVGFNGAKGFLTWARKVTELIKLTLAVEGERWRLDYVLERGAPR